MGTTNCPEVRECTLSPKERASARDSFVRAFERQFSDWTEIAKVCIEVERDQDYILLGFASWHAWLLAAAPRSRSYIYLVVGRYKELSVDIPADELAQIPLGSAGVLKQLSSKIRQDPAVRTAARKKPSELRQAIRETHPEQLIEGLDARTLNFTESQALVFDEMLEAYRWMNNHGAGAEEAVECICANWLEGPFEQDDITFISNRERAEQIKNAEAKAYADEAV